MLLDPAAYPQVIQLIGDSPHTVIPLHFVLRRECEVFVDDPKALRNLVIRTEMAFVYGQDGRALEPLIAHSGLGKMMWTSAELAQTVKTVAEKTLGVRLKHAHIEQKSATVAPAPPDTPGHEVRRMDTGDLDALNSAPEEIQWTRHPWGSWDRVLAEGIVVGALHQGQIVSLATTFGRSQAHDDIGVATASEHQTKGLCTACGARIMAEILALGRTPVWTVDVANKASFRVSEKLGFVTQFHAAGFSEESE